jgi:hypothetical protein
VREEMGERDVQTGLGGEKEGGECGGGVLGASLYLVIFTTQEGRKAKYTQQQDGRPSKLSKEGGREREEEARRREGVVRHERNSGSLERLFKKTKRSRERHLGTCVCQLHPALERKELPRQVYCGYV